MAKELDRKVMIQRHPITSADLNAAIHDIAHAMMAQLLELPWKEVRFGKETLVRGGNALAAFEYQSDVLYERIANVGDENAKRELLTKITMVARIAQHVEREVLKLPKEEIRMKWDGDRKRLEDLFEFAKAPSEWQTCETIADARIRSLNIKGWKVAILVGAKKLLDRKTLGCEDIQQLLAGHHISIKHEGVE